VAFVLAAVVVAVAVAVVSALMLFRCTSPVWVAVVGALGTRVAFAAAVVAALEVLGVGDARVLLARSLLATVPRAVHTVSVAAAAAAAAAAATAAATAAAVAAAVAPTTFALPLAIILVAVELAPPQLVAVGVGEVQVLHEGLADRHFLRFSGFT